MCLDPFKGIHFSHTKTLATAGSSLQPQACSSKKGSSNDRVFISRAKSHIIFHLCLICRKSCVIWHPELQGKLGKWARSSSSLYNGGGKGQGVGDGGSADHEERGLATLSSILSAYSCLAQCLAQVSLPPESQLYFCSSPKGSLSLPS